MQYIVNNMNINLLHVSINKCASGWWASYICNVSAAMLHGPLKMATDYVASSQTLLTLPPEILEKVLSFLRYEEISNSRLVSITIWCLELNRFSASGSLDHWQWISFKNKLDLE